MAPDLVLADILYLTLAAAQRLGVEGGKPMMLVAMGGIQPAPLPVPPDYGFAVHWFTSSSGATRAYRQRRGSDKADLSGAAQRSG